MSGAGAAAGIGAAFALDPLAGAMGGFASGGLAGAAMGAAVPLAATYALGKGVQGFVHGGQQAMAMNQTLGQNFGFMNQGSRTGFGFSRQDAAAITGVTQQMAHIPELLTSFEELNRLVPKLRQSGAFAGVRSADEFRKVFTQQVHMLRDISKVLGSTMEEAAQVMQQSRSVGFTTPTSQIQNAMNVRLTSAMTGMGMDRVMQMQQAGAGMASQMGIRRNVGARAVTNMAQQLQGGIDSGSLDQGLLEDIAGATGDEAVGAGAERLTGTMTSLMRGTAWGRQAMFALAKFDESGRVTGVDKELAERLKRGELSLGEMRKRASGLSRTQKMSVTGRINTLAAEAVGATGAAGLGSMIKGVMGDRGFGEEGMMHLLTQKLGASEVEAEAMLKLAGSGGMDAGEMEQAKERLARDTALRQQKDPKVILEKLKTRMHAATVGKLEHAGAEVFNKLGTWYDEFWDDVFERYSVTLSKEGAKKLESAFSETGKKGIQEMFARAHGVGDIGTTGLRAVGKGVSVTDIAGAYMGGGVIGAARPALQAFRESEFGAEVFGGRTEAAQLRTQLSRFGADTEGLTGEAQMRAMTQTSKALTAMGERAFGDERYYLKQRLDERLAAGGTDTTGMTEAQKYEARRRGLADVLGGEMYAQQGVGSKVMGFLKGAAGIGAGAEYAGAGEFAKGAYAAGGGFFGALSSTDQFSNMLKAGKSIEEIEAAVGGSDALASAVGRQLGKSTEESKTLLEGIKKSGAKSMLDGMMQVTGMGDVMKTTGAGAFMSKSVQERAKAVREAEKDLVSKTSDVEAAFLKANPGASKLMEDMKDPKTGKEITTLLGKAGEGNADALRELKEKYGVSNADLGMINSIKGKLDKDPDIMKSISHMKDVQAWNDLAIHHDAVMDAAASVEDSGMRQALNVYAGSFEGKSSLTDAQAGMTTAFQDAIGKLKGAKTPEEREKIIKSMGQMGGALQTALGQEAKLKKGITRKDLAGMVGEEEAAMLAGKFGIGDKAKALSGDALEKVEASIAAAQGGQRLVRGKKGETAGEKDERLLDSLKKLDETLSKNSSVIEALGKQSVVGKIFGTGMNETSDSKTPETK